MPKDPSTDRFHLFMAWVMLAVVFVGFAPSYFLKPLFDTPVLPFWTHVHGVLFTGWFVVFAVQAALVRRRRVGLHRRLGRIGGFLALLMAVSGGAILAGRALEYDGSADSLADTALVVSGNVVLLVLFAAFVALGVLYRRRPAWHRRFMLLASIAMTPQALGRLGRLPLPPLAGPVPNEVLFGLGGMLALLGATWVHDLRARGRLHPVTGLGAPFVMAMIVFGAAVLPNMGPVRDLILWINGATP